MTNKEQLLIQDVIDYDYQAAIFNFNLDANRTKYLIIHSKFDRNNIAVSIEVWIKIITGYYNNIPQSNRELLFSNYSLSKAIEFYNNLK